MFRVLTYSVLLILGMVASPIPAIDQLKPEISALTMIFLAYIMIQVGMEFEIDKSRPRKSRLPRGDGRGRSAVADGGGLFLVVLSGRNQRKSVDWTLRAPTSAGILFTMLAAAGLAATWTYKKARVLAIFDDLDTVLLMIPLKMMLIGFTLKCSVGSRGRRPTGSGVLYDALVTCADKQLLDRRLCGACLGPTRHSITLRPPS